MGSTSGQRVWHRVEAPGTHRGHAMEGTIHGRPFRAWENADGTWMLGEQGAPPVRVQGDWSAVRELADQIARGNPGQQTNPVDPLTATAAVAGAAIAMRHSLQTNPCGPRNPFEDAAARSRAVQEVVPGHWITGGVGIGPGGAVSVRVRPGKGHATKKRLEALGFPVQVIEMPEPRPRTAGPRPNPPGAPPPLLIDTLGALQAAYLIYRAAHWQVKGAGFYGDHLLLAKIYEESEQHADDWAEQLVGYYGPQSVDLTGDQLSAINRAVKVFEAQPDPLRRSLRAALTIREFLDRAYKDLKDSGELSLGWDDLIMSVSREKDKHVYLLQQALGLGPQPREGYA